VAPLSPTCTRRSALLAGQPLEPPLRQAALRQPHSGSRTPAGRTGHCGNSALPSPSQWSWAADVAWGKRKAPGVSCQGLSKTGTPLVSFSRKRPGPLSPESLPIVPDKPQDLRKIRHRNAKSPESCVRAVSVRAQRPCTVIQVGPVGREERAYGRCGASRNGNCSVDWARCRIRGCTWRPRLGGDA
jgi:hypothetical protein